MTTAVAEPISIACEMASSALSAKKSMNTKITAAARISDDPQRVRDHARGAVDPIATSLLTIGRLVEPLRKRRLLCRRTRVGGPQRPEERDRPWLKRVTFRSVLHTGPLLVDDVPPVADELARDPLANRDWQELGRLQLLRDEERLGLGTVSRLVVRREREEDHESREDGEAGGQHAENARCPVAIGEVAPFRSAAADEQHDRDRDGDREHQDGKAPDEIHGEGLVHGRLVRARAGPARGRARRTHGSPQPCRLSIRRGTRTGWSRTRAASRMRGLLLPKRHFASGLGVVLARDAHEREPEAGNALQKPLHMRLVSEQPDDGRPSLCALETHTFEHRCIA